MNTEKLTIRSMFRDLFCGCSIPLIVILFVYSLAFLALAIYSGIWFFRVEEAGCRLMYAVIFIVSVGLVGLMKIFGWQIIHRVSIKREIADLRKRIEELHAHEK